VTPVHERWKNTGLVDKYVVSKKDGSPVAEDAEYFVLRLDEACKDHRHVIACRAAAFLYASMIRQHLPLLSSDIIQKIKVLTKEHSEVNWSSISPAEVYLETGRPSSMTHEEWLITIVNIKVAIDAIRQVQIDLLSGFREFVEKKLELVKSKGDPPSALAVEGLLNDMIQEVDDTGATLGLCISVHGKAPEKDPLTDIFETEDKLIAAIGPVNLIGHLQSHCLATADHPTEETKAETEKWERTAKMLYEVHNQLKEIWDPS